MDQFRSTHYHTDNTYVDKFYNSTSFMVPIDKVKGKNKKEKAEQFDIKLYNWT